MVIEAGPGDGESGVTDTLAEVVRRAGVPYGYTLTIWAAGALCIRRFGLPDLAEVFLFVGGGTIGYGSLALVLRRRARRPSAPCRPPLWENAVVMPVVASTYGIAQLVPGAWAGFFVVPAVATALYLLGLAVLLKRPGLRPARSPGAVVAVADSPGGADTSRDVAHGPADDESGADASV